MIPSLLVLISIPLFISQLLRWLSIAQQKEYRWDRILLFIKSAEGKKELFLIPKFKHFTRTGLKRPVTTFRAALVGVIYLIIFFKLVNYLAIFVLDTAVFQLGLIPFLVILISSYLLIPVIVVLSTLISSVAYELISFILLILASKKIIKSKPTIIGITGSYGKTSTKLLLAQVLSYKYSVFTTPASYNTKYSIAKSIVKRYKGEKFVILEYAAYTKGEIRTLTNYFPVKIAVVTGITSQHLGLFGSMDKLISAKSELVAALPKDGIVFCNGEDKKAAQVCKNSLTKIINYTEDKYSNFLKNIKINHEGKLSFTWKNRDVHTNLIGKHYIINVLAAITISRHLGLNKNQIISAIESFVASENFVQVKKLKSGALIIDDSGTSNPRGFAAAIDIAKDIEKKKKLLIFSGIVDLGKESQEIHESLAKDAEKVFSLVLYSGQEGKEEFRNVFKDKFIEEESEIFKNVEEINKDTLLLVEGRIPKIFSKYLESN